MAPKIEFKGTMPPNKKKIRGKTLHDIYKHLRLLTLYIIIIALPYRGHDSIISLIQIHAPRLN